MPARIRLALFVTAALALLAAAGVTVFAQPGKSADDAPGFEGALYLAPVVILVIVLFVQGRKEDDEDSGPDAPDGGKPARDAHA